MGPRTPDYESFGHVARLDKRPPGCWALKQERSDVDCRRVHRLYRLDVTHGCNRSETARELHGKCAISRSSRVVATDHRSLCGWLIDWCTEVGHVGVLNVLWRSTKVQLLFNKLIIMICIFQLGFSTPYCDTLQAGLTGGCIVYSSCPSVRSFVVRLLPSVWTETKIRHKWTVSGRFDSCGRNLSMKTVRWVELSVGGGGGSVAVGSPG